MKSRLWAVWGVVVVAGLCACMVPPPMQQGPTEAPVAEAPPVAEVPPQCAKGRAYVDHPDDEPGELQLHILYVVASDGEDRELDTKGIIAGSTYVWNDWLGKQTGGRYVRLDMCGGRLDLTFVRLGVTAEQVRSRGVFARDALRDDLIRQGWLNEEGRKIYLVLYDGETIDASCGGAPPEPTAADTFTAIYLRGRMTDTSIPTCESQPFAAPGQQPTYIDFAALHDVFHTLGAVQTCAPNANPWGPAPIVGHTGDHFNDLMYTGSAHWYPDTLDPGRDDYFDHDNTGCYDVADSPFLSPTPLNPQLPPSWSYSPPMQK